MHNADWPPDTDSAGDPGDDSGSTPRRVFVSGIVLVIAVLVFAIVQQSGGGLGHHRP